MRNIATMRAISKAQLRDFFSIGSIVLAAISAEFSISRSILVLYNNNSRQSRQKMLVSQHPLFLRKLFHKRRPIARCGKHLCTNGKQSTILPNNKTLMDTKTAPADKSDECCFFIGIVLFGREVITL